MTPAPGLLISAARLLPATPGSAIAAGHVLVRGDKIVEVGQGRLPRPPDLALNSGLLAPGFVDLQINGYFGEDFAEADVAGWAKIARRLPETGTTAFLPTVITAPLDRLAASIAAAPGLFTGLSGARVLGLHVEGPFISPDRKGAHNSDWIINPTPSALTTLLAAGAGQIRIVTLAPERDGALDAIATLAGAGVLASVGHSDATAAQVAAAADAGARMVTHLFNAQSPLRHRAPGVPGQALTDHRLTSGLIADLEHVDAEVCAIAFAAAPGRICLVTDAAACAGMPPGEYILGGEPIELPPGDSVPPVRRDGTLAGSALRLDVAVANMVGAGADLAAAITAATRIPADLIGRPELGRIAPGAAADLVWLDDDLRTRATWVAGEMVYSTSSPPVLPQT